MKDTEGQNNAGSTRRSVWPDAYQTGLCGAGRRLAARSRRWRVGHWRQASTSLLYIRALSARAGAGVLNTYPPFPEGKMYVRSQQTSCKHTLMRQGTLEIQGRGSTHIDRRGAASCPPCSATSPGQCRSAARAATITRALVNTKHSSRAIHCHTEG
jgi:hypothetical protein